MRKVNEQQTTFEQGGFGDSGLILDGDAANPNAGSTVKSWAINDVIGAFAAILKGAGIESFNGQPETEDNSQIFAAIQHLIDNQKNVMDAKINALREELQTQYAALAGNNIFTGDNQFNAPLNTEAAVNHNIMPNHNEVDLIDKGDLEAKNYADKNYVSGSIAEITKDSVKVEQGTDPRLKDYVVGTTLLVVCKAQHNPNEDVSVYFYSDKNAIFLKPPGYNFSTDHGVFKLEGTWRARGYYIYGQPVRLLLVQRVA